MACLPACLSDADSDSQRQFALGADEPAGAGWLLRGRHCQRQWLPLESGSTGRQSGNAKCNGKCMCVGVQGSKARLAQLTRVHKVVVVVPEDTSRLDTVTGLPNE